MGMYADDLIEDYSKEFLNEKPVIRTTIRGSYKISIIHRYTGSVEWVGYVNANSKKGAQINFRNEYPDIRRRYTHEYGLLISKA